MESQTRQLFGIVCDSCGAKFESFTTPDKFLTELETEVCSTCGGKLRKDWAFGMGKFNGPGFTRSNTN